MIQLPRSFFRQLRTVLRRAFSRVHSPVVFQSGSNGISVRCQQEGVAVAYHSNDRQGVAEQFGLPVQAIADIEGKGNEIVTLETKGASKVQARWQDAGIPRVAEYDAAKMDSLPEFPQAPTRWAHQDQSLLKALDDAMQTASHDAVRFALNKIQIRGSVGVITATDGHALLWQNSFQFPFTDDVLIPRTNVFGCKELQGVVNIAKTKTHVCIQVEPWTIFLLIDKDGRFPKVESIIPSSTSNATRLTLTPENSAFLVKALPRLPGDDDTFSPVTLDLNGEAIIRARADGKDQSTEVVLQGANVTGKPVRFATNRQYVARALELGFTEGHVIGVEAPMLFQDDRRKYVFQGLGKDRVVAPANNDLRMNSEVGETNSNTHEAAQQRRNSPMRSPRSPATPVPVESNGNGTGANNDVGTSTSNGQQQPPSTFAALLEEGQSIQNALRDLLLRTNRLMVGLKAYRRHAKTMQSTLASLRQLQQVEA